MNDDEEDVVWISASQLAMFEQCERKWKFRYIDKIKGEATPAMVVGTFVHSVLENLYQLNKSERTVDSAKVIAREEWEKLAESPDFQAFQLDEEGEKKFRITSWNLIKKIWDVERPQFIDVIDVEQRIEFEVAPGVKLIGFIDRISNKGGKVSVDDYKTGKRPFKRYEGDKVNQIYIYALAVSKLTDHDIARGRLLFLGGDDPGIVSREITQKVLDGVEQKLVADALQIQQSKTADEWPPTVGPLCGWCDYFQMCPEGLAYVADRIKRGNFRKDAPAALYLEELRKG